MPPLTKTDTARLREPGRMLLFQDRNSLLDRVDALIDENQKLKRAQ